MSYEMIPIETKEQAIIAGLMGNEIHQLSPGADPDDPKLGSETPLFNFLQSVGARPLNGKYPWLGYWSIVEMQTKEVAGACGIFAQNTTYTQNPEFAKNYVHTAWLHVHPNHGRRALATQAMVQMMRMANKFGYPSWFTLMDCPANTPPKGRGVYVDRLGMTELMTEEMKKIDNKFVHIMLELYNADPVNPNRELDLYWLHIPNLAEHLPMLDQVFADILPENQLHCDEVAALAFLRRQQQRF